MMPPLLVGWLSPAVAPMLAALTSLAVTARAAEPLSSFSTEKEAQGHCPGGLVVWLDRATKVYYFRGQQKYGSTQSGGYVCRDEAKRTGIKESRSSQ